MISKRTNASIIDRPIGIVPSLQGGVGGASIDATADDGRRAGYRPPPIADDENGGVGRWGADQVHALVLLLQFRMQVKSEVKDFDSMGTDEIKTHRIIDIEVIFIFTSSTLAQNK
jgi:hypothetical protein